MYNLAIESVRKYPLPLICEEQLAALEGFGNFFINRVAKLMKRHYLRGRAPTEEEMEQDDRDHLEGIRENLKRITLARKQKQEFEEKQRKYYDRKIQKVRDSEDDNSSDQNSDQQGKYDEERLEEDILKDDMPQRQQRPKQKTAEQAQKFERILFEQDEERFKQDESEQQQKQKVTKSKQKQKGSRGSRKNYKPRKGTEPFEILKAIIDLEKMGKSPVIKGDINQYLFNKRKQKMKGWTQVRQRLVQFQFLTSSPKNQDEVAVTEKGRDYVYELENNSDSDLSSSRSRSSSPNQSQDKKHSKSSKGGSSGYSKRSYTESKKRHSKSHSHHHRQKPMRYKPQISLKKQQLLMGKTYKTPVLLYNEKSEINQRDDDRIYELMTKITQFQFREESLSIGEFAWEISEELLDYLLFRFKCESFDLDQFFLCCQRVRQTQCENAYFVFQESLSKNADNRRDLVNSLFADGRVAGFKMIRTSGIGQTIEFIKRITLELIRKVKLLTGQTQQIKPIYFLGKIDEFNENLKRFKPALVRNVAISCLKCVPNISREMIKKIIKKMPGMWFIYKKLKLLKSNSERKKFLYWYLQQFKPKKGTVRLIVDLMFFESYEE